MLASNVGFGCYSTSQHFSDKSLPCFYRNAQRELSRNGVTFISDTQSDICITSDTVRLTTGESPTALYLTGGQQLSQQNQNSLLQVRPYARKNDTFAMARTSPFTITSNAQHPPPCDINHSVPAVIFSNSGFAGNFFHDVNDVIIPLFLTSSHLHSRVQFVITDYEKYWVKKYCKILTHVSSFNIIVASSSSSTADKKVHCFPAAVVGLKYHGNLLCNSTSEPGGVPTAYCSSLMEDSMYNATDLDIMLLAPLLDISSAIVSL